MSNNAENSIKAQPTFLKNNPVCHGKNLGHPRSFSASTTDNRDAGKKKPLAQAELIERITKSCSSMKG